MKVIVSAERRLAAVSNESRVRVEVSKNTVATVFPRSAGHLRDRPLGDLGEGVGEAEHARRCPRGRGPSIESRCRRAGTVICRPPRTSSPMLTPSSLTSTSSSRRVGRFLPTKSGRIGSSRWPRSTITASWTARARPWSASASSAARTVRPVNSTSSTRTTTWPVRSTGISVTSSGSTGPQCRCRRGRRRRRACRAATVGARRSRASAATRRSASGTPPVWSPTTTRSSVPWLRSTISWAMRTSARRTSSGSIT